ncbi:hypothetical protein OG730_34820 [Streptomyces sp. NBC_01298]|uniref:hypothetical protein n=1 Tax=Streptomyces sp. NBC_01298 TaxID=2903817 RepID=UPI002E0D8555|nr:hypothetical protein OG730_34820 [Streptomyces sp. NBC_01298]
MNADELTLRDRAIDAVGQALNDANYWLPVEGRPIAVDAVLALVSPSTHPALDLIRASITAHETKADEAHDADRHRSSNEHAAIAAGLRIAEAHILAALEPPKETPDA